MDRMTLDELLDALGFADGERMQFCTQAAGEPFAAIVLAKAPVNIPQDRDVWFGVNPCTQVVSGRPGAADVTRLAALWVDLDVKAGGCADFDTARLIIDDLSDLLGSVPVAVIMSGHGLQPLWRLDGGQIDDEPARSRMRALLRRWGRLVRRVAELRGARVDGVFDLPRILRCPGSVNWKDATEPVAVDTAAFSGTPVDVDRLAEVLDEYGVAEFDGDSADPGALLSAPDGWHWADRTCGYAVATVAGWADDNPGARHPWLVAQAVRLAALRRNGCLTADGHEQAITALVGRLHALVGGDRGEGPGESSDALIWGQLRAAAMTDEQLGTELGGHRHADESIPAPRLRLLPALNGANALDVEPEFDITGSKRFTDDGNALALIAKYGGMIRYCAQRGRWLRWDGMRWRVQPSGGGLVREMAKDLAREIEIPPGDKATAATAWRAKSLGAFGVSNAITQASTDQRITVELAQLDADPWALNTPGGIVDLRTGAIAAGHPAGLHTRVTLCAPDAAADPTTWHRFLDITFGGDAELIGYLQRLVGYSATGHVGPHVLPFAHGSGGNGKGVFLEALAKTLGDYATTAPNSFLMARQFSQHETEIARLAGARMVICSEVNDGDRFDEAKVKQLTGGDTLTARFMRQDHFTFAPTHHLWLMGNARPAVTSGGRSFWRRCRLIPFAHEVPDADIVDDLQGKLAAEHGPAILAWIVRGAVDYVAGGLREPATVRDATAEYARDQDTVGRFVDECCHRASSPLVRSLTRDVIAGYEQWCSDVGETPVTAKRLGFELRGRFDVGDYRSNGKRFYTGISLIRVESDQ